MMAFDVCCDEIDFAVVIFATGEHHAVQLFCDHHEAVFGAAPGRFSIARRTISREVKRGWLREALGRGRTGLSVLDDNGWMIMLIRPVEDQV